MKNERKELIQWHLGFRGAIKTELEENQDILEYLDELAVTKKELKLDLLIIKLKEKQKIKNSIGHTFRRYNIFEYKGANDYISLDDFYKVYAYACIFKSDTNRINERKADSITLSFVSSHYPQKMISHLLGERGYKIKKYRNGIYYIIGDYFPIQIIINTQLDISEHLWLKSLTSNVQFSVLEKIILEYEQKKKDENREVVVDTVIKANYDSLNNVKEVNTMSKVLLQYMEPHIKAEAEKRAIILAQEKAEILAQEKAEVLAEQKAEILAQEKAEVLAEQKAEVLAEQKAEVLAEQKAEVLAEQKAEVLAEQKAEVLAEQKAEVLAEQKAEVLAEQKAEVLAEQKAEVLAEQKAEVLAEQKAEVLAEQKAEILAQQKAEALTEKKLTENNKRIALLLKKNGLEISQIQDITNLTIEELKTLFSQINE